MTGLPADLEELRLQVEVMAIRVQTAVARAVEVVRVGDSSVAEVLVAADDEIDAMHVSLTERCYETLLLRQPMASDLRLVVSVLRVLSSLERVGDLSLRVAKTVDDRALIAGRAEVFAPMLALATNVEERMDVVVGAWSAGSADRLAELDALEPLESFVGPLTDRILELQGADAARAAVAAMTMTRAFDRIGDHAAIIAARLGYLLTADPNYLAEEVHP